MASIGCSSSASYVHGTPNEQIKSSKISKKKRHRRRRNRSRSNSDDHESFKHAKVGNFSNDDVRVTLPVASSIPSSSESRSQDCGDNMALCGDAEKETIKEVTRIQCTINYPNGARYEGSVLVRQLNGKSIKIRDGHGIYIDENHNCHEGLWKDDLANGHGVKEYISGDSHEGGYVMNKRSGWGKYVFANGNQYVGEFSNGIMHGQGTFLWINGGMYEGEWYEGRMHGRGIKRMENGDIYEGQFEHGVASGWGKKQYTCDSVHEGLYSCDKRCGFGCYVWPNGDRYEGDWLDGKMQGRGRKIMANGDIYHGSYNNDQAEGYGYKIFACGDKHEGYYKNDKRHLYGKYSWANGDSYEGYFNDGHMCGVGVKRMANGDYYDGEFDNDMAHGYGVKIFANGDMHEGEYKDDKRECMGTYTYANGERYVGQWKNGTQSGIGMYHYLQGDTYKGRWENSKKNGPGYYFTGVDIEQSDRIFLEIWSDDERVHREEIDKNAIKSLPPIEEVCRQRSPLEIILTRKKLYSAPMRSLRQRKSSRLFHRNNKSKNKEYSVLDIAQRWRWAWDVHKNPYKSKRNNYWERRRHQSTIISLINPTVWNEIFEDDNVHDDRISVDESYQDPIEDESIILENAEFHSAQRSEFETLSSAHSSQSFSSSQELNKFDTSLPWSSSHKPMKDSPGSKGLNVDVTKEDMSEMRSASDLFLKTDEMSDQEMSNTHDSDFPQHFNLHDSCSKIKKPESLSLMEGNTNIPHPNRRDLRRPISINGIRLKKVGQRNKIKGKESTAKKSKTKTNERKV